MPRKRAWLWAGLAVVGVLVLASVGTFASHQFSDVPTSPSTTHNAVAWLVARAVTAGCAPGLYCPTSLVDRAQMAIFMNRLGAVLSPRYLGNNVWGTTTLDIDVNQFICQTADSTVAYPHRARIDAWVSLHAVGAMSAWVIPVYSSDAGTTWIIAPFTGNPARASASAVGEWAHGNSIGVVDLAAGTYRYALRVNRDTINGGTTDPDEYRCGVIAEINNRNPDGIVPDTGLRAPSTRREEAR